VPVHGCLAGRQRKSWCAGLIVLFACALSHAQNEVPVDAVAVRTGTEVWVTFTQTGARLTKPMVWGSSPGSGPVVAVKLERSGSMRTLYITNGFAQPLHCRARIRFRGRAAQMEHEMGPIGADGEHVMTFTDPVEDITLFEFRLQTDQAAPAS
jgi:hypothetical protein